jgi:hypothetical protein
MVNTKRKTKQQLCVFITNDSISVMGLKIQIFVNKTGNFITTILSVFHTWKVEISYPIKLRAKPMMQHQNNTRLNKYNNEKQKKKSTL